MERLGVVSRRMLARLVAANDNLHWKSEPAGAVISPSDDAPAPGVTHITAETLPPDSVEVGAGEGKPVGTRDMLRRGRARIDVRSSKAID
jgi:hypothetical protein